ncbi:tyrosine-type recombinase/integrase [Vibrio parahaemolyticus]|uniref:tyrosine-type recombinase/integrase n=1 Tax=Vibrio parahaemolyticus TaxID=670 RepID=UPI0017866BD2|nr:site-specific integrase [Vibrio parahaemolyticus]MBD6967807.1 tyrosine-type recombinase/integrase [Vibrio parahaemolyticus]MBD6971992.1 tyrosine-type recombinase/integrase [Vibrio parahaemolyticus]
MATVQLKISDAGIKRALADEAITQINAMGEPFVLRIHANRETASWYLVSYKGGKTKRTKLANWPDLTTKQVLAQKHELIGKLAQGDTPTLNDWQTVGELLTWYCDRALSDRSLSKKRKLNIKSSINKHLIPCLGNEPINELAEAVLDTELVWPLQSRYALGTVKQHFALLKRAFKQAKKLKRLAVDPMASMVFSDFIDAEIKAKPGKLKAGDLPLLWQRVLTAKPFHKTFIMLMLGHGTRIGETRQLRWDHIDIEGQRLIIPGDITKTGTELVIPLTPWMFAWLDQHKLYQGMWGYRGPYLFANPSKRGAITEAMANDWVKAVSQGEWTAHDLRKCARSCWADLGVDYMVAERLLNHALSKLDQAYIHTYVEQQKREALTTWHNELARQKEATQTDTTATPTEFNEHAQALQ